MPLQLADVFGRVMVEHGCCVLKIGGIVVSILHFCGRDGCRSLPIHLSSPINYGFCFVGGSSWKLLRRCQLYTGMGMLHRLFCAGCYVDRFCM